MTFLCVGTARNIMMNTYKLFSTILKMWVYRLTSTKTEAPVPTTNGRSFFDPGFNLLVQQVSIELNSCTWVSARAILNKFIYSILDWCTYQRSFLNPAHEHSRTSHLKPWTANIQHNRCLITKYASDYGLGGDLRVALRQCGTHWCMCLFHPDFSREEVPHYRKRCCGSYVCSWKMEEMSEDKDPH